MSSNTVLVAGNGLPARMEEVDSGDDEMLEEEEEEEEDTLTFRERVETNWVDLTEKVASLKKTLKTDMLQKTAWTGARLVGKAAWIVATTGIIMALPLILEVDREHLAQEQEKQMRQQQQQMAMQPGGLYAGGSPPGAGGPMPPQGGAPTGGGGPLPVGVAPQGSSPARA